MPSETMPDPLDEIDPGHVEFFDFENDEEYRKDPQGRLSGLGDKHRVFYTPKGRKSILEGGTWVFTRAADIRDVLQDFTTFKSSGNRPFGKALGENWVLIPIDLDPPEHTRIRKFMNPIFSPRRIADLSDKVERRARELILPLQDKRGCSFIDDFARPFPVTIFLEMFGLPVSEMATFVRWVDAIIHRQREEQLDAMRELRDYLAAIIEDRKRAPTDDLISIAVTSEVEGKPLTYDEVMGMCVMLFMGGLDTVTSALSFIFKHLAEHPEDQEFLRQSPDRIPAALEELLRFYPIITTGRIASRDFEIDGITIREGQNIACLLASASRDPDEIERAREIDLTRDPNRHSAFGFGPHRCIGSHLARRELTVALEQWLKLLPPFRVAPGAELRAGGAGVVALEELPLVW